MLTLDEVKEFLRIDHNEEDGYISVLLLLAKELCENYLRKDIIEPMYENRSGGSVSDTVYRLLDAYRKEQF